MLLPGKAGWPPVRVLGDQGLDLPDVERLAEHADDPGELCEPLGIDERGHDGNLEVIGIGALPQLVEEGDAVHHRHLKVEENERGAGEAVQRDEGLGAIPCADDTVAVLDQSVLEGISEVVVVFGDENGGTHVCDDAMGPKRRA